MPTADTLVISGRRAFWEGLFPFFIRNGLRPAVAESLEKGLPSLGARPPAAVILDLEANPAEAGEGHVQTVRAGLIAILQKNAAVHTAVVSFLNEEEFHDAFEGLGVLCRLPPAPGEPDIGRFAAALREVGGGDV